MRMLFVHRAFPAQFGRIGLELKKQHGWDCRYIVGHLTSCPTPTPEMLATLPIFKLAPAERERELTPWSEAYGQYLQMAEQVYRAAASRPEFRTADLIVGHLGLGPTLFLPDLVACPVLTYAEYFFANRHADLTYRVDLPPAEPAAFYPRCINAPQLTELVQADAAYSATAWQRASFPKRFHDKIAVQFDGVDTEQYRPGRCPRVAAAKVLAGRTLPEGTKLVTYVARGLESMRGFDIFLEVAGRISRERSDVLFAVVGGTQSYYGWDRLATGKDTFRDWALERHPIDADRFVFLGQIQPDHLANVLSLSDLHFYLTVPFVTSWSLVNALSSGCLVLASDVEPVREVLAPGENGLVENFFDVDRLTAAALRTLDDPSGYQPLREAARASVLERYSLEVCIPALKQLFEATANRSRRE